MIKNVIPSDDIDFTYILQPHGWSDCYLFLKNETIHFNITHVLSDPIADMIDAIILLNRGEKEITLIWYDEPGKYKWTFKINQDQQHLVSILIFLISVDYEKQMASFEMKIKQLTKLVFFQFLKVASLLEEKSYKEKRSLFPYEKMKELSKIMKTGFAKSKKKNNDKPK